MPPEVVATLREAGHEVLETDTLETGIADVDIVYSTRIQEERFASPEEADLYRGRFRLNQSVYTANCEPNTVIMHPLPRDSREGARELDTDLNDNPNLAIFARAITGWWSAWRCSPSFWMSPIRWSSTRPPSIGTRSGGFDGIPAALWRRGCGPAATRAKLPRLLFIGDPDAASPAICGWMVNTRAQGAFSTR